LLEFKLAEECETRAIHPVRLSFHGDKVNRALSGVRAVSKHVCFVTVRVYVLLLRHLPMKRGFSACCLKAVLTYKTGRRLYPDRLATDHFDSDLSRPQPVWLQSIPVRVKSNTVIYTVEVRGRSGDRHGTSRTFGFFRLPSGRSRRPLSATVHLQSMRSLMICTPYPILCGW
jgi:hypothetical protein